MPTKRRGCCRECLHGHGHAVGRRTVLKVGGLGLPLLITRYPQWTLGLHGVKALSSPNLLRQSLSISTDHTLNQTIDG